MPKQPTINIIHMKDGRYRMKMFVRGQRMQETFPMGTSLNEVEKIRLERLDQIAHNVQSEAFMQSRLFHDYLEKLNRDKIKGNIIGESSLHLKERIHKYIHPLVCEKKLSHITTADIREIASNFLNRGWKPSFVCLCLSQINQVFEEALIDGFITSNPVKPILVKLNRAKGKIELDTWNEYELSSFIASVKQDLFVNKQTRQYMALVMIILAETGMRISEVYGLSYSDFNFQDNTLHLSKSMYNGVMREYLKTGTANNRKHRTIKISPALCEIMKQFDDVFHVSSKEFIFSRGTSFYCQENARKYMKIKARECGLSQIRIHDLRHSVITNYINRDYPIAFVAKQVGDDIKTLLSIYYNNRENPWLHENTIQLPRY